MLFAERRRASNSASTLSRICRAALAPDIVVVLLDQLVLHGYTNLLVLVDGLAHVVDAFFPLRSGGGMVARGD
jgi:hypothetical protein